MKYTVKVTEPDIEQVLGDAFFSLFVDHVNSLLGTNFDITDEAFSYFALKITDERTIKLLYNQIIKQRIEDVGAKLDSNTFLEPHYSLYKITCQDYNFFVLFFEDSGVAYYMLQSEEQTKIYRYNIRLLLLTQALDQLIYDEDIYLTAATVKSAKLSEDEDSSEPFELDSMEVS